MTIIIKNNTGITIIALIITIIIILILVSVGTYEGIHIYESSQMVEFVARMQLIQAKVDEISTRGENILNIGTNITIANTTALNTAYFTGEISSLINTLDASARYLNAQDIKDDLGLDNIEDEIVINFNTREVVSLSGIDYDGRKYYTQYLLPNGQQIVSYNSQANDANRTLNLLNIGKSINGLNATITIDNISITNGTLSYSNDNINWATINNYTQKNVQEKLNVTNPGIYYFKLIDNTNSSSVVTASIEILLANKPNTTSEYTESYDYLGNSSTWAYQQTTVLNVEKIFVWIPRYAYDSNENIKFTKGTTNIAADNTALNGWVVPSIFTNNSIELTGIWIEVDSIEQYSGNLNISSLVADTTRENLTKI